MNNKGILLESVLLIIVISATTVTLSNSHSFSLAENANTVRDYYDLTTKWQNARFLLDQETSNWMIGQTNWETCSYTPGTPDYSRILNAFNAAENNIDCSASASGTLQNNSPFTITLSCTFSSANGSSAIFEKSIVVQKNVGMNGSPAQCTITDTQSGLVDYTPS
jgi:hypothetical protein